MKQNCVSMIPAINVIPGMVDDIHRHNLLSYHRVPCNNVCSIELSTWSYKISLCGNVNERTNEMDAMGVSVVHIILKSDSGQHRSYVCIYSTIVCPPFRRLHACISLDGTGDDSRVTGWSTSLPVPRDSDAAETDTTTQYSNDADDEDNDDSGGDGGACRYN